MSMMRARGSVRGCGLAVAAIVAATTLLMQACDPVTIKGNSIGAVPLTTPVSHMVFIKLNDPTKADDLIAECNAKLPTVKELRLYSCGRPYDTNRPSVDGNYDVGLYMGFESAEAYRRYLDHPVHKDLVKKWEPAFAQIRIFDLAQAAH